MNSMKVLLNDGLEKEGREILNESGIEAVKPEKKLDSTQLVLEIGKYDGIIVRSATKVTKEVIESGAKGLLKIVGRAGVGIDNIDLEAAAENGIIVKTAPLGNTDSVAELSLGLMFALSRNITRADASLRSGKWVKKAYEGQELAHKTLGIIGCGRIGQRLATIARGVGMEVVAHDPYPNPDADVKYVSMDELLRTSDYVSINVASKGVVIGSQELSLMKPSAYLINAARGKNLDENALYCALKEKKIAGAGLDVFMEEPKEEWKEGNKDNFTNNLRTLDNVVLTSHLGASTKEAQRRTAVQMANSIRDYLLKGDFSGAVNVKGDVVSEGKPLYRVFVHHKDVPGAFASFDKIFADNNVNIRDNPSRQIKGDRVVTVYLLHQKPDEVVVDQLKSLDLVYRVVI